MADETKTGGTEGTGFTGTTGGPEAVKTDQTPKSEPDEALDKNKNADVEAQQFKGSVPAPNYGAPPPPYSAPYTPASGGPTPDYGGPPHDGGPPEGYGLKTFDCEIARKLFVQKVFGMVGAMLAVVTLMTLLPFVSQNFRIFAFRNYWLMFVAYIPFFCVYIPLMCCACARKKAPLNYILTGIMVVSLGFVCIGVTIHVDVECVLVALVMTTLCSGGIIIFAMTTNWNMNRCGPIIIFLCIVILIVFIVAIPACIFFHVRMMYAIYSGLMAIIMMCFLAYDVQMMVGGKHKAGITVTDPFYASIHIFMDIVLMFLYMVAAGRRD